MAADLKAEQAEFSKLAERARPSGHLGCWPDHPAFGPMSHKAWGKLVYKHTEHHLKQFGV